MRSWTSFYDHDPDYGHGHVHVHGHGHNLTMTMTMTTTRSVCLARSSEPKKPKLKKKKKINAKKLWMKANVKHNAKLGDIVQDRINKARALERKFFAAIKASQRSTRTVCPDPARPPLSSSCTCLQTFLALVVDVWFAMLTLGVSFGSTSSANVRWVEPWAPDVIVYVWGAWGRGVVIAPFGRGSDRHDPSCGNAWSRPRFTTVTRAP